MLNNITVMGRLTHPPELRMTQTGIPVCSFSIACERPYKSANGAREVDYLDVTAWRHVAEFVSRYLSKGRMAVVEGRLQIREWLDHSGNKRRSAEIVANNVHFGDSKPQAQTTAAPAHPDGNAAPAYTGHDAAPAAAYSSSNVPASAYPGSSVAPAPAYSGSAAPRGSWQEIDDDDGDLPF